MRILSLHYGLSEYLKTSNWALCSFRKDKLQTNVLDCYLKCIHAPTVFNQKNVDLFPASIHNVVNLKELDYLISGSSYHLFGFVTSSRAGMVGAVVRFLLSDHKVPSSIPALPRFKDLCDLFRLS